MSLRLGRRTFNVFSVSFYVLFNITFIIIIWCCFLRCNRCLVWWFYFVKCRSSKCLSHKHVTQSKRRNLFVCASRSAAKISRSVIRKLCEKKFKPFVNQSEKSDCGMCLLCSIFQYSFVGHDFRLELYRTLFMYLHCLVR